MTGFDAQQAAAALLRLRRGKRQVISAFPGTMRPATLAEGIATQVALAGLLGAATPAGFKIGATTEQMRDYLGLPHPIAGFMPEASLHGSGSTLNMAPFLQPGVECELAVHLVRNLPPGPCSPDQAAAAVGELMAGIEVVENRYAGLAAIGAPALVADQVFHAAAILGTPYREWRSLDLAALPGRMLVDGAVVGEGRGGDLLGGPMQALAWLAGSAEAAAFGGLRAGQMVMLGSVTPPIWLDRPGTIEVQFPPLPPVMLTFV